MLSMIVLFVKCIDGQELSNGVLAQLEGTVDVPALCSDKQLELLVSGEHEMVRTMHFTGQDPTQLGVNSCQS